MNRIIIHSTANTVDDTERDHKERLQLSKLKRPYHKLGQPISMNSPDSTKRPKITGVECINKKDQSKATWAKGLFFWPGMASGIKGYIFHWDLFCTHDRPKLRRPCCNGNYLRSFGKFCPQIFSSAVADHHNDIFFRDWLSSFHNEFQSDRVSTWTIFRAQYSLGTFFQQWTTIHECTISPVF